MCHTQKVRKESQGEGIALKHMEVGVSQNVQGCQNGRQRAGGGHRTSIMKGFPKNGIAHACLYAGTLTSDLSWGREGIGNIRNDLFI